MRWRCQIWFVGEWKNAEGLKLEGIAKRQIAKGKDVVAKIPRHDRRTES
jgi:hypothetical protein